VVEACREVWPEGEFDFMSVDAFSIKALADACAAYARSSSRLDYLVLTQGMATIQGYTPTDSGLDQKLVLHHFGRMASILALRDLLTTTSGKDGADVRVLSVLSAGVHSPLAAYKQVCSRQRDLFRKLKISTRLGLRVLTPSLGLSLFRRIRFCGTTTR
jgi:hypothetical protein